MIGLPELLDKLKPGARRKACLEQSIWRVERPALSKHPARRKGGLLAVRNRPSPLANPFLGSVAFPRPRNEADFQQVTTKNRGYGGRDCGELSRVAVPERSDRETDY